MHAFASTAREKRDAAEGHSNVRLRHVGRQQRVLRAKGGRGDSRPFGSRTESRQHVPPDADARGRRAGPARRHLPHHLRGSRLPHGVGGVCRKRRRQDDASCRLRRNRQRISRRGGDHLGRHGKRARRRWDRPSHGKKRLHSGLRCRSARRPLARRCAGARLSLRDRPSAQERKRGRLRDPEHLFSGAQRVHRGGSPAA